MGLRGSLDSKYCDCGMNEWCYFRGLGYLDCDGFIQRAHLIPKQRMKIAGVIGDMIWDERCWIPACKHHHHQWDNGFIMLDPDDFPPGIWSFAREISFYYRADDN